jgi:hypothetical protein
MWPPPVLLDAEKRGMASGESARPGRGQVETGPSQRQGRDPRAIRENDVPRAGLEPARPCGRDILSVVRMPIPPPGPVGEAVFRPDYMTEASS